jgi:hypothetical protein
MKYRLLLLLIVLVSSMYGQVSDSLRIIRRSDTIVLVKNPVENPIFICKYGDPKLMILNTNGKVYDFKQEIADGLYIAYYDEKLTSDTAMLAVITNGKVNGLQQRWDEKEHRIWEECEYKDGKRNGYCKWYYYIDGKKMINVDRWENNIFMEDIQIE